jgi:hypothetical protein
MLLGNCKKEHPKSSLKDIPYFTFQMADNPSLKADFSATINQTTDTIRIGLPQSADLSSLIPTIGYDGASISPANKTATNFSTSLQYTVTAQDGSARSYIVVVSSLSSAKAITSFIFWAANNSNLTRDDTGVSSKDTIRVYIDPGTDLTNLIPTITYTGTTINPGNVAQNFTSPSNTSSRRRMAVPPITPLSPDQNFCHQFNILSLSFNITKSTGLVKKSSAPRVFAAS